MLIPRYPFTLAQPSSEKCAVCHSPTRKAILAQSELFSNIQFPICNWCLDMRAEPEGIVIAARVKKVEIKAELMTFYRNQYVNATKL